MKPGQRQGHLNTARLLPAVTGFGGEQAGIPPRNLRPESVDPVHVALSRRASFFKRFFEGGAVLGGCSGNDSHYGEQE